MASQWNGHATVVQSPPWVADRIRAIEGLGALDAIADRVASLNRRIVGDGRVADALRGTWLGHPLHPALTDLPIGFWTSATVLDVLGGARRAPTARALVGLGVLSALPTAAAGAVDWRDMDADDARPRRLAAVHAAANVTALALYTWSWAARRRHRVLGVALGLAGATAATVGGYLGGELVFPAERDAQDAPPAAGAERGAA